MPHIKLEHTENIESSKIQSVFNKLINILIENARVKKGNCKCKTIKLPICQMGSDDLGNYYHLEISLLKGRPEDVMQIIGEQSLQILQDYFTDNKGYNNKQLSVEIREINPGNYFTSNSL